MSARDVVGFFTFAVFALGMALLIATALLQPTL